MPVTGPSPVVMEWSSLPEFRSYAYNSAQLFRSDDQMISCSGHSMRHPAIDSNCVGELSSNSVRTAPVAASAILTVSCLWSRDVLTYASCEPSGLQIRSLMLRLSP